MLVLRALSSTASRKLLLSSTASAVAKRLAHLPEPRLHGYRANLTFRQHATLATRRKDVVPTADTIFALSTAPGRSAIAIIRISGPACLDIYGGLCPNRPFPHPRTATLRKLYEPGEGDSSEQQVLDNGALVLYYPSPNTVTGEDVLELHVHGGPAIVKAILEAIPKCTGSRPRRRNAEYSLTRHADPGEFTRRAFYNGRVDLTQAEALGEALAAETEQQRRLAIIGADSGLARRYQEWRQMLLHARGELEALIDFSEDQHFDESPAQFMSSVSIQVANLNREIMLHIRNAARGELLRNGITIALIGAPNAGKSSLLNRIVGREAAIVNAEAGTTRDIVDVSVDINGWLCRLGDMAGLRSSLNAGLSPAGPSLIGAVEREGIRRARERALQSDVVIVLLSVELNEAQVPVLSIDSEVLDAVQECQAAGKSVIVAVNKVDLLTNDNSTAGSPLFQLVLDTFPVMVKENIYPISCLIADSAPKNSPDPGGVQNFLEGLTSTFASMTAAQIGDTRAELLPGQAQAYWTSSLAITERQSANLRQCAAHLADFLAQAQTPVASTTGTHHTDAHEDLVGEIDSDVDIVTAAEHLRYAASCLSKITGRGEGGDIEDVLGVIFEK